MREKIDEKGIFSKRDSDSLLLAFDNESIQQERGELKEEKLDPT